jgi:hypothetical protein
MKTRMLLIAVVGTLSLFTAACQLDVERNADGSLQIEAVIEESDIATELEFGTGEDEMVTVDLKDGYALIAVEGPSESGRRVDTVSFRLELFVEGDHLGATATEAVWNGIDIPQELVDIWNEELAAELEAEAKEDPDSTLVDVEITETQIRFEFRVETEHSKG